MPLYRMTWRHELLVEAKDEDEAWQKWGELDLDKLDAEQRAGSIVDHGFVGDNLIEKIGANETKLRKR